MRLSIFPLVLLVCITTAASQASPAQTSWKPLPLRDPVQDKNFYLLSLLKTDPKALRSLAASRELAQVAAERQHALSLSKTDCKGEAACTVKTLLWTDEEIRAVSSVLEELAQSDAALRDLTEQDIRPSGAYILFDKRPTPELLADAWEVCARGINNILSVYGQDTAPRYPLIDSPSVSLKSADFQKLIESLASEAPADFAASGAFFEPSLKTSIQLLALNHRDEAGRFEPMEAGVNQTAVKALASTLWEDFSYTVIVVPGAGSVDPNVALSPAGHRRCALAAEAYWAHKAPFLLVSGGFVHPSQTRFSEAIEMRKALVEEFHIPESAILVDPHARHTTTNLRNAAREIYRYNIPQNKPALVISDAHQTAYIASNEFAERCLRELGYVPYRILSQPSDTALAFMPRIESLQQDPMDPLDP